MSNPLFPRHKLRRLYRVGLVVFAIAIALIWQQIQTPQGSLLAEYETAIAAQTTAYSEEPIVPIPIQVSFDQAKYSLGEKLFKEPRLSQSEQVSCLSCHKFEAGGADRDRYSKGMDDALTQVNTPTIFNVAYNFRFNWDGKHASLAKHTDALMQNPTVMGTEWAIVKEKMETIDEYRQAFETIYPDGISKDNVIDAIVTYEAALTTPDSPFDQYLRGDSSALSAAEKEGYGWFKAYGCVSCHQGVNIGGNMFQKVGVMGDYFADRGNVSEADFGRFNTTGKEADRYVFRVPSLRNVAMTPPYLHDGNAQTLKNAIEIMVKYQLGRPIPAEHVDKIAQFLQTLTGEYEVPGNELD
ncbi:MAG: cytochrome c peroxidase [Phormidesmis sp.]